MVILCRIIEIIMLRKIFYLILIPSFFMLDNIDAWSDTIQKRIAMTIDDLPFVGSTYNEPGRINRENQRFNAIMHTLVINQVPAVGFVIGGTIERGQWDLLQTFSQQPGLTLGNHTYTHRNLNSSSAEAYINEITRTDQRLSILMKEPKFFRYPYLAEGSGLKKQQVQTYLHQHGYIVAPITIDSKDFKFNAQLLAIYWRNR